MVLAWASSLSARATRAAGPVSCVHPHHTDDLLEIPRIQRDPGVLPGIFNQQAQVLWSVNVVQLKNLL